MAFSINDSKYSSANGANLRWSERQVPGPTIKLFTAVIHFVA